MYRDAEHHERCESACLQCLLTAASQGDFEAGRLHRRLAHTTMQELREGLGSRASMAKPATPQTPNRLGAIDRAAAFQMRRSGGTITARLIEEADPLAHAAISACAKNGWSLPEVGFEPTGPDGSIVGIVELAWPQKKIAAVIPEQKAFGETLVKHGWTVVDLPLEEAALRRLFE